jgi:hypothetical protein
VRLILLALLKQALSAAGHRQVVNIIELERVLREHYQKHRRQPP